MRSSNINAIHVFVVVLLATIIFILGIRIGENRVLTRLSQNIWVAVEMTKFSQQQERDKVGNWLETDDGFIWILDKEN